MTVEEAGRRWAETWERGWAVHDVEAIVALYAEGAGFLTSPFRETQLGPSGVREYVEWAFADEASAEARFGQPVVAGNDRAVGEWWTVSRSAGGEESTLAGVSLLRFGADGLVTQQYDYWHVEPGRRQPHEHFGRWPQR